MTAPSQLCQTATGDVSPGNPCHLSAASAASGLGDWEYLANFIPPADVVAAMMRRFGSVERGRAFHDIRDAIGDVNLDFYPVEIEAFPFVRDTTTLADARTGPPRYTPVQFFDMVRRNINRFIDGCAFAPYNPEDAAPWQSHAPVGAVLHIDLGGTGWSPFTNPDDGSVVCAEFVRTPGDYFWLVSTLWTPADQNHPVSGNRKFGLAKREAGAVLPRYAHTDPRLDRWHLTDNAMWSQPAQADTWYFYVRAADRTTTWVDGQLASVVFSGGHAVWRSLQQHLVVYINQFGGRAAIPGWISQRWDWARFARAHMHPSATFRTP